MAASPPLSFFYHFANLQDDRCESRCTYRLMDIIFIAFCATIAGAEDWPQIVSFAQERRDWLAKFCKLPPTGETPCRHTFERVFKRINAHRFSRCFGRWATALIPHAFKHVAIDGKSLRGSARKSAEQRCLHLVSAWATENHISLAQVAVNDKSNEITAIPLLLEMLELEGALVTIDAMGTQKEIAKQVVEAGADYVLVVKKNQKGLYQDIERTFAYALGMELDNDIFRWDRHIEEDKGHGRRERREYLVLSNLGLIRSRAEWAKLSIIGRCVHEREVNGKVTTEVRYFIGSRAMSAKEYGQAMRGHWGIENNCHWQLDVTFGEDANRVADRNTAENLSSLRRQALALLKRHGKKASIANKQFTAALSPSFLEEVLHTGEVA